MWCHSFSAFLWFWVCLPSLQSPSTHPSFKSSIFPLVPILLLLSLSARETLYCCGLLQSNVSQPKTNFNSTHELYCYMAGIQKAGKVSGHRFRIAKCFLGGNTCMPQTQLFTPTNLALIPIHSLLGKQQSHRTWHLPLYLPSQAHLIQSSSTDPSICCVFNIHHPPSHLSSAPLF